MSLTEQLTPVDQKLSAEVATPTEGRSDRLRKCAFSDSSAFIRVFNCTRRRALLPGDGGITMPLKLTNREVAGVSVVDLDGRIVLGEESNSLREKLKSLIAEGKKKIVLNMANVKYIDSTGLGTLVAAHVTAKTQGASVRLSHLGQKFHEIMQVTKLLTVFDVYDTEAAALSSFQGSLAASS